MNRFSKTLAVFFLLAISRMVDASPASATMIITADVERLYPFMTDTPPVMNPAHAFERELRELRNTHQDAYLIDAGNHLSLTNAIETPYGYTSNQLFRRFQYDVVALSARDAALGLTGTNGYNFPLDPLNEKDRVVSNLHVLMFSPPPVEAARSFSRENRLPIRVMSLADRRGASAIVGQSSILEYRPSEDLQEAAGNGDDHLLVAVASMTDSDIHNTLGESLPDVVIRRGSHELGEEPHHNGSWWEVRAPRQGEILVLKAMRNGDGSAGRPEAVYHATFDEEQWSLLVEDKIPLIGHPLPDAAMVVRDFLPLADSDRIQEDRIPIDPEEFSHLTGRDQITVYHVQEAGTPLRLYRLIATMKDHRFPDREAPATGWPRMNIVVAMTEDHRIHDIISRLRFDLQGQPTSLFDAAGNLKGLHPDEWDVDPELILGLEEVWEWILRNLVRVIEVDRRLFGGEELESVE